MTINNKTQYLLTWQEMKGLTIDELNELKKEYKKLIIVDDYRIVDSSKFVETEAIVRENIKKASAIKN